jgi:hypothetical protein
MYVIQVDIYERATHFAYPIVQHRFIGKTPPEAAGYHQAHKKSDRFLRECEDKGMFEGSVSCHAVITEGWQQMGRGRR